MNSIRSIIILGTAACIGALSSCNSKSNPTAPASEKNELQGIWSGKFLGDDQNSLWTITFLNDTAIVQDGTQLYYKGIFNAKDSNNIKNLDILISETPVNPKLIGKTSLGVYQINKDTLSFAANEPGNLIRPASIMGDSTSMVFVLVKK